MVEKTHKPLSIARNLYAKYSEEYKNITGSPHQRLSDDYNTIYGFGGIIASIFISYKSIIQVTAFNLTSIFMGIMGLGIGLILLKHYTNIHRNSIN